MTTNYPSEHRAGCGAKFNVSPKDCSCNIPNPPTPAPGEKRLREIAWKIAQEYDPEAPISSMLPVLRAELSGLLEALEKIRNRSVTAPISAKPDFLLFKEIGALAEEELSKWK